MEPWGRIAVAVFELFAAILLLISATAWLGAVLAVGLMAGALLMHLTKLGISVQGDGGYLFVLALIVLFCSGYVLLRNRMLSLKFSISIDHLGHKNDFDLV